MKPCPSLESERPAAPDHRKRNASRVQRPSVSQELQLFARNHRLPDPVVFRDSDGTHLFLYSSDKTRRYAYALTWAPASSHLLWVMLNPGIGESEGRRRNTFERCKAWAHEMGYGGLLFGNVFSIRTKSAKELLQQPHRSDALNDHALELLSGLASETIVAWGNHGAKFDRPLALRKLLSSPKCLGLTKAGQPRHPLYVPARTPLVAW